MELYSPDTQMLIFFLDRSVEGGVGADWDKSRGLQTSPRHGRSEDPAGLDGHRPTLTWITLLLRPVMSASFWSVWASGLLSWANWACMIWKHGRRQRQMFRRCRGSFGGFSDLQLLRGEGGPGPFGRFGLAVLFRRDGALQRDPVSWRRQSPMTGAAPGADRAGSRTCHSPLSAARFRLSTMVS